MQLNNLEESFNWYEKQLTSANCHIMYIHLSPAKRCFIRWCLLEMKGFGITKCLSGPEVSTGVKFLQWKENPGQDLPNF